MRVLFAGSPAIAVPSLRVLAEMELSGADMLLAGVLTNPDARRGRGGEPLPTDVSAAVPELDAARKEKGLPPIVQLKPPKLGAPAREEVAALAPDLLVSFAYGRIFGPRFLSLFPLGGINIHPSLLPKYRGASPIPAVILAREKETGVCIQKLAPEMDAGDLLAAESFPLSGRETTLSLSGASALRAAAMLGELFPAFTARAAAARPQEGEASYCGQIQKEAGRIDWNAAAVEIDARIRAYTPWPLSFTRRGNDTLFILEARPLDSPPRGAAKGAAPGTVLGQDGNSGLLVQTGDGVLAVSRLQWQAKKALDWKAFLNGARDFIGTKLG